MLTNTTVPGDKYLSLMITNNHTTNLVKVCSKCLEQKSIELFPKRGNVCKQCQTLYNKRYYTNNQQKIKNQTKEYYENNKPEMRSLRKLYYRENQQKIITQQKEYVSLNKEKRKLQEKYYRTKENYKKYQKEHRSRNKIFLKEYNNQYHKQRKANDPAYRLLCNLRNRIQDVLKKTATGKTVRTKETFGCPLEEVVKHIESQFKEGMSWENYGLYTWHIDHIKPLSSFDLSNPEEVKKANHYTNLQPLWAKDNLSKGDKF